jgi:HEPN domain-containing protein
MPHEADRADAPSRWLTHARADLALANVALPPGGLFDHLCFHAQQAAETVVSGANVRLKQQYSPLTFPSKK